MFEYSVYLAALPPLCWAAGLTSCMFAVESIGFNGALLYAAYRFYGNSSRGQAHARRLFLVSLAYLPVFFGCLMLHQKRRNTAEVEEEVGVPLEEEEAHPLERLRARALSAGRSSGRELCIHEQIIDMSAAAADGEQDLQQKREQRQQQEERQAAARRALATSGMFMCPVLPSPPPTQRDARPPAHASGCPVVVAEAVKEQVAKGAAAHQTGLAQPQPQHCRDTCVRARSLLL